MNSPTHTPQPRRVPADTPVLFRVPQLETPRQQTRQIEVEIPLRGRQEMHPRPQPERAESGDWPYATKASAATLGLAALLWVSWVVTQGPSSEPTGTPAVASRPVDGPAPDFLTSGSVDPGSYPGGRGVEGSEPDFLTSDQTQIPGFRAGTSATNVAQQNPSSSADSVASQLPGAAQSAERPTPMDSVADSAATSAATLQGGTPWKPGMLGVAPPTGTQGVASGSGWVAPASAGQPAQDSGTVRASATPNPPQFTPYVDATAEASEGFFTGPMLSATPNGVADWSRYLTPDQSALQPASASLPGAGEAAAAGQVSGQAIYVDKPPAVAAEAAAAPFYE